MLIVPSMAILAVIGTVSCAEANIRLLVIDITEFTLRLTPTSLNFFTVVVMLAFITTLSTLLVVITDTANLLNTPEIFTVPNRVLALTTIMLVAATKLALAVLAKLSKVSMTIPKLLLTVNCVNLVLNAVVCCVN